MILAAHMLGGMLPCKKVFKKCAILCVLVNILIRFCIKIVLLKCSLCIEQYDIMLMGFQGIFPMNKHEIWSNCVPFGLYFDRKLCLNFVLNI